MNSPETPFPIKDKDEAETKSKSKSRRKLRPVKLELVDDKSDKKDQVTKTEPEAEGKEKPTQEAQDEIAGPAEKLLTEEELLAMAKTLREEARRLRAGRVITDEDEQVINQALNYYDHEIIEESTVPETAFSDTLNEFVEPVQEDESESNPAADEGAAETADDTLDTAIILEREVPLQSLDEFVFEQTITHPDTAASVVAPETAVAKKSKTKHKITEYSNSRTVNNSSHPASRSISRPKVENVITPALPESPPRERQVANLNQRLQTHETTIRRLVKEKTESNNQTAPNSGHLSVDLPKETEPKHAAAKPSVTEARLGRVVVHERKADRPNKSSLKQTASKEVNPASMSRQQLVEFSATVSVDNTNLKKIYESHLINEAGLRRLAAEYVKGKDIKTATRREIVEHQIDFERDPALKDVRNNHVSSSRSGSNLALANLIRKAEDNLGRQSSLDLANVQSAPQQPSRLKPKRNQRRRIVNSTLTAVVTFLALLVVLLYFTKIR